MKRWDVVAAALAAVAALALAAQLLIVIRAAEPQLGGALQVAILAVVTTPAVVLGVIVARRRPDNVVGALLTLIGTASNVGTVLENWGATVDTADPLPGADAIQPIAAAAWMLHYLGPVLLVLVFPTGRLLAPVWRVAVVVAFAIPVWFATVIAVAPDEDSAQLLAAPALLGLMALLVMTVVSVAKRYRRSDDEQRRQLRWLVLSATLAPAALAVCWAGVLFFDSFDLVGIVLALLLVALSVSVAVAMLRHRLYGFDRLLAGTVQAAAVVAAITIVFAAASLFLGLFLGGSSPIVAAGATLAAALVFLPVQRWLRRFVDKRFQPRRERLLAAVRAFVVDVREGTAAPEDLAAVLARAGAPGVDVVAGDAADGRPVARLAASPEARLTAADLRELEAEARLPIELARLRGDLRDALAQTDASRARLVTAADDERRRIQRDLHDGAQSNLVALGMRLRELQRHGARGARDAASADAELGEAVELVQRTIGDLRALAQGVRPSALDEGLEPALRALVKSVPLRIDLALDEVAVPEPSATAAYYVAAEAVTNALKHARPGRIGISLARTVAGTRLAIEDDGAGGASEAMGSGLAGIRDRVETVGGRLRVSSGLGTGTLVEAIFP